MRRSSRSFTVEVKRSRSRAGESAGAGHRKKHDGDAAVTVSDALSWGDLISRLSAETGPGRGAEDAAETPVEPLHDTPPHRIPSEASPESGSGTPRARVLPSLLPVRVPLSERTPGVLAGAAEPRSASRSRLPRSGVGQAGKPPTDLRRTQADAAAPEPERDPPPAPSAGAAASVDRERVQALVDARLRQLQDIPPVAGGETAATDGEIDARPVGGRRRQDFWKHRLRSYAARD